MHVFKIFSTFDTRDHLIVQTIDYSMQGIVSVQNAVFQRYTKLL